MTSEEKIRFGIIGCSRIAKKAVIPAIIDSENAKLEMIGSRSIEKARLYSGEFGNVEYGSYEDILNNKNIDVVYISLPIGLHEEWVMKSAQAGKHIICEKSLTTSFESAKKMFHESKKNNVRLMEGFMFRYHPQHKKILDLIKEGKIGTPIFFEGVFSFPFPDGKDHRFDKNLGGGCLNDSGAYPVYASRMIFGEEPISVYSKLDFDGETGVDINVVAILNYSGVKKAFISSFFGAYFQSKYSVLGESARITSKRAYAVPKNFGVSIIIDKDDKIEEIGISAEDHFKLMVDDFCREIKKGKESKIDFEKDLLMQAKVMEAIRISDKEKRNVNLSEIS